MASNSARVLVALVLTLDMARVHPHGSARRVTVAAAACLHSGVGPSAEAAADSGTLVSNLQAVVDVVVMLGFGGTQTLCRLANVMSALVLEHRSPPLVAL